MKTPAQICEELKELRENYDDLRYYLPDALLEVDIVTPRLLYMNQMALALFGYTDEDFAAGIPLQQLFDEPEFERAVQIVQGFASESQQQNIPYVRTTHQILYEFVMQRKDGTKFQAETQSSFILDKNAIPFAMRTIIRDASQRKRAEEALRISEERFALAVSAGKVGIWEWDIVNNTLYLSANLKAFLGYADDEIGNDPDNWLSCVHPDDRDVVLQKAQEHIEGKTTYYEVEHRMIHKDGSIRWLLARGKVTRNENGEPIRMTGSDTDLTDSKLAEEERVRAKTAENRANVVENINKQLALEIFERKRFEKALRESEERYRELYENIPSMYFTVNEHGIVITVNTFGAEQLGYEANELLGKSVYEIFHEADKKAVRAQIERCARNPNLVFQWEFRKIKEDGTVMWVKEIARAIRSNDGTFVLIVCEDITDVKRIEEERRKLEAQLLHTQKMESLGVLAGGIAHDFNNLLTGVLGNAGMILMELLPDSPLRESVKLIESAAVNAAQLTNQLLAYAGRGKYLLEVFDFSALIREMSQLLKTAISKSAHIHYELARALPAAEGDTTQIRQILLNLITNASDAIGEKPGQIVVSTGAQSVNRGYLADSYIKDDLPEGEYVFMEVSDTGCGMDPETQSRIFDPFFSTKFAGRGLGLAAVMGIMRSHRGAIKVSSTVGKGTTIRVLFPASSKTVETASDKAHLEPVNMGNGTVLVIDDEEQARIVAKKVLNKFGFTVLTACDGLEGIQIFQRSQDEIRVVLLDMSMPRLNGEHTLQHIRRLRPDQPVVLSSGYDEYEAYTRFEGQGLAGFIQKPYQPLALIEKINTILNP
ncbi:MAG TPA: PAS domain S-box protein [bacterium]